MNWIRIFFMPGLLILTGLFILSRFFLHARKGAQRRNWPSVTGEIIASEIKEFGGEDTRYHLIVRYRYRVNLVEYESTHISLSEAPFDRGSEKHARTRAQKYQVHDKVNVFYNPELPGEAVLDNSEPLPNMLLLYLILGGGLLACGLMPLILMVFNNFAE
jgi:hypothetical protein